MNLAELQAFAQRAVLQCLKLQHSTAQPFTGPGAINVVLVSDRKISLLHRRFLKINGPTDVITFQHGEVFMSTETARRNARRFKSSNQRELELYIVHGLLHLLGFEDDTPAGAREMERVQKKVLSAAEPTK